MRAGKRLPDRHARAIPKLVAALTMKCGCAFMRRRTRWSRWSNQHWTVAPAFAKGRNGRTAHLEALTKLGDKRALLGEIRIQK